jgi:tight adherence protein C
LIIELAMMSMPILLLFAGLVCLVAIVVLVSQKSVASNVDGKTAVHIPTASPLPRESPREMLRRRLIHAGLYKRHSSIYYYTTQAALAVVPVLVGVAAFSYGAISLKTALITGAITGIAGVVFPGLWLDYQKAVRQTMIRRAIPDALDVATICVEAGLSLNAALLRVAKELRSAYPMLSTELTIVNRQIQMGKSTGESLRSFAERFDLEELRLLSSVVTQSERFGASIANALRVQGDSLRTRRMQRAQEKAQVATLKILFPTAFCIFPAIFVVILGPALFDLAELLRRMNGG